MILKTILSNKAHPEFGQATIPFPILNRLTTQSVNVDELDYLTKRLDSFCQGENEKFQAMACKLGLSDIKEFINHTLRRSVRQRHEAGAGL